MEEIPEVAALFGMKADLGGISPIERLLNEFEAHEMKEQKSLEQYKELMGDLPNPVTRFLLQLIISDEEKHRAVIHAMVATLKGSLTWTKPEGSLESTRELSKTYDRLRAITEEFIELEKEGIRESKRLIKRFFWDESGKELKRDQGIKQAILKKGVADAGSRTVPTVDGVRGTVGSDRSENRL